MGDQVARLEHGLTLRRVSRQEMEIANRNAALALAAAHMDRCFQRGHGDVHVGGIRCDAMLARAKDRETAIEAIDRRATRARLALVARHRGVAEIDATRPLQQVAAGRGHIANLRRVRRLESLRKERGNSCAREVMGQVRIAHRRTNRQPAVRQSPRSCRAAAGSYRPNRCGVLDIQLHQIDQRRAARDEADIRALLRCFRLARRRARCTLSFGFD